jgi:hypothetical protein
MSGGKFKRRYSFPIKLALASWEEWRISARNYSLRSTEAVCSEPEDSSAYRLIYRAVDVRFEDWRDAPRQFTEPLRENYDAFIFADFGHYRCELYALKTNDELPLP